MNDEIHHDKSALDHDDGGYSEPWEIPTVIVLVILAALWLIRAHARNQQQQQKGSELCRRSLKSARKK